MYIANCCKQRIMNGVSDRTTCPTGRRNKMKKYAVEFPYALADAIAFTKLLQAQDDIPYWYGPEVTDPAHYTVVWYEEDNADR